MENKDIHIALTGDVGGTNIRLTLLEIDITKDEPLKMLKKDTLLVKDHDNFEGSIRKFLQNVQVQPEVAVIGIAGPIDQNKIQMANVPKWGLLNGFQLAEKLKFKRFRFINDFEANSYGILLLPQDQFQSINGLNIKKEKNRGVMGPGTGLGNSILYSTEDDKSRVYVMPSEGGHTDFPTIDEETSDFIQFYKEVGKYNYISLERSFCGPAIPTMFKFFCKKYPQEEISNKNLELTSEQILKTAVGQNPSLIFQKVLELFLKIYSAAVGNYISQHMCVGGLYLVGSITNTIMCKIQGKDFLKEFKERHPQITHLINAVPLILCKQIDLGLKGAFFVARRFIRDEIKKNE